MIPLYTALETRRLEQQTAQRGLSFLQMMENAGRACCESLQGHYNIVDKRVAILCGKGGNGGDGFVVARHLQLRGALPFVVLLEEPQNPDAIEMYQRLGSVPVYRLPLEEGKLESLLADCAIIVDAVYGLGMRGELPDQAREIFALAARLPAYKVAIDLPSGLGADEGDLAPGAFEAQLTIALGCYKVGHFTMPGARVCGKVVLRSFGEEEADREESPTQAFTATPEQIFALMPPRDQDGNKGSFGNVLNIAGSRGMSGAALLSTKAALRSGAGLVRLVTAKSLLPVVGAALFEPVVMGLEEEEESGQLLWDDKLIPWLERASATCVGCGLRAGVQGGKLLEEILNHRRSPLVIDADGINILAQWPELMGRLGPHCLLTPHPLEFSRLTGLSVAEIESNRRAVAQDFAARKGVTLLLKGSRTLVASPEGRCFVNQTGNSGLSKGGSGDVLTGMIVGFAAQGVPLFEAAALGCCLHGGCAELLALERSVYGILPTDLIEALPLLLKQLERVLA